MVGHTRDEIKLFTMLFPGMSLWPRFVVNKLLRFLLGPLTDQVLALYSYSDYKHPVQLLLTVSNDAFISRGFLTAEALAGQSPVYYYRFDWDDTRFAGKMGAFHGLDEPLVFGALEMDSRLAKLLANPKAIRSGRPLSEQMMSYYTNFAKTGDPNGPGLPAWPAYTVEKRERLYFDNPITLAPLTDQELARYRFFAQYTLEDMLLNKEKEQK
jgi:para-nitrobenzyl esterase